MAEVISGGVSTLPGAYHSLPKGCMCDEHTDRAAVARIQGETDSMGCELIDMCQTCVDEFKAHAKKAHHGVCDWCRSPAEDLRPHRDFEEGSSGRIYDVCRGCIKAESERLVADMDGMRTIVSPPTTIRRIDVAQEIARERLRVPHLRARRNRR